MGTEQDIFDSAAKDEDEVEAPAPAEPEAKAPEEAAPTPQEATKPPAAPDAAPQPEQLPPQQPQHQVPLTELLNTRERAQAAERERDAMRQRLDAIERERREAQQKPPEPPDQFADPQGYTQFLMQTFEQRLAAERQERDIRDTQRSFVQAQRQHGPLFQEAWAEFQRQAQAVPALRQAFDQLDPWQRGEEVVGWYNQQKIVRDPAAYEAQLREKLLSDPDFVSKAAEKARELGQPSSSAPSNVTRLPPSLNSRTSAASARPGDLDGSDEAIWAAGNAKRR